jgi:antitoxin component YwqK of YwqJK toxin-antitoxin module
MFINDNFRSNFNLKKLAMNIFKQNKNIFFIIFIMLTISCKEKIHYEYYENGNIKETQISLNKENNSNKEYIIMRYKENGALIDSFYTINGEINGIKKTSNNKDSVIEYSEFKNNILNGNMIAYFPNGKVRYQGKMLNGKRVGTWLYYYKNGNISAFQQFMRPDSTLFYRKYYDNGEIAQTIGKGIVRMNKIKDTVKVNEIYETEIYPVFPPNCKINIFTNFKEKTPYSKKFGRINFEGFSQIILKKQMKEIGVFDWKLKWEIIDTLRNNTYKGSSILKVIVI